MTDKSELTKYLNLIVKIGVGVVSSILIGFGLGYMVDKYFNLRGVGVLIGVFLGVVAGFFWLYSEVMSIGREENKSS